MFCQHSVLDCRGVPANEFAPTQSKNPAYAGFYNPRRRVLQLFGRAFSRGCALPIEFSASRNLKAYFSYTLLEMR